MNSIYLSYYSIKPAAVRNRILLAYKISRPHVLHLGAGPSPTNPFMPIVLGISDFPHPISPPFICLDPAHKFRAGRSAQSWVII